MNPYFFPKSNQSFTGHSHALGCYLISQNPAIKNVRFLLTKMFICHASDCGNVTSMALKNGVYIRI